jgi:hypothetical protein
MSSPSADIPFSIPNGPPPLKGVLRYCFQKSRSSFVSISLELSGVFPSEVDTSVACNGMTLHHSPLKSQPSCLLSVLSGVLKGEKSPAKGPCFSLSRLGIGVCMSKAPATDLFSGMLSRINCIRTRCEATEEWRAIVRQSSEDIRIINTH